ncbi:hypothetical protein ED733_000068 [Metarhizium rileyi]|uniref:L-arabinitol 4-dehydrogenase n=1 Tax=Metarhizium rileyi (strain RCEF 4871) TaxID=1649241 RepID=A0A5C6G390_METRR|nr:hypothetical protein ED733_000068 [Metarhizium rileyi]
MGHEASGTVYSTGSAVTSLRVGDHVAIEPGHPCSRCQFCKSGVYNLCPDVKFAAAPPDTHGMLSKFWKAPEDFVHKVPDDVSLKEAVLVEPLSVAVHASRLAKIKPGDTVVITGSGTIGLLCGAVSRAFGAHRIIVVDILEEKLRFGHQYLGADTYLLDLKASPRENADILTSRYDLQGRVDVIIEASGAESSVQMGIYLLKSGGSYVQTGIGKPMLQVPMLALSEKELRLRGCFRYGAGDFDLAIKLLSRRSVNLSPLISSVTPFERTTEVWDMTSSGKGIKNLIQGVRD